MTPPTPEPLRRQLRAAMGGRTILETMMSESSLADVAAAAAAPVDPAAPAPAATAAAQPAPAAAAAAPQPAPAAQPAPDAAAAPAAAAPTLTARAALELTALAYPAMSGTLTKLAAAADGGETAFRAALLAERTDAAGATDPVSTAQTSTTIKPSGAKPNEGRGGGLKAAAQAQNAQPKG